MNHHETNDWRVIAHDEYENRKSIELQLSRTSSALGTLKQTLTTSNNYNGILEKKLAELEAKCADQEAKLTRSVDLLRNAKLLFVKRKEELAQLTTENIKLKEDLVKKSALLEAEMLQHEKTNYKLAQTLNKLAAATAAAVRTMPAIEAPIRTRVVVTSPDVIYAEAAPEEIYSQATPEAEFTVTRYETVVPTKQNIFKKLLAAFELESIDAETGTERETDSEFMDQMLNFEKLYNK